MNHRWVVPCGESGKLTQIRMLNSINVWAAFVDCLRWLTASHRPVVPCLPSRVAGCDVVDWSRHSVIMPRWWTSAARRAITVLDFGIKSNRGWALDYPGLFGLGKNCVIGLVGPCPSAVSRRIVYIQIVDAPVKAPIPFSR